jgi:uncharacterized membrane protein YesL
MDPDASGQRSTSGWRIALKGLSDTLENLLPFTIASLSWWLGVITILLAPAATRALFQTADPRIASSTDRPAVTSAFRHPFSGVGAAWRIALIVGMPVLILLSNLRFYAVEVNNWSLLIPLWLMVLVCLLLAGLVALSVVALLDMPARRSLRLAGAVCLGQPRRVASMLLVTVPVTLLGIALVIPILTLLPAMIAATINRLALSSLGIPTAEPLIPTQERAREEAVAQSRAEAARRFGP